MEMGENIRTLRKMRGCLDRHSIRTAGSAPGRAEIWAFNLYFKKRC